jgi:hypothetical protein
MKIPLKKISQQSDKSLCNSAKILMCPKLDSDLLITRRLPRGPGPFIVAVMSRLYPEKANRVWILL